MGLMAQLLKQGRYADEVMALLANQTRVPEPQKNKSSKRSKPVGFQPGR
jgi:hypothetical protein